MHFPHFTGKKMNTVSLKNLLNSSSKRLSLNHRNSSLLNPAQQFDLDVQVRGRVDDWRTSQIFQQIAPQTQGWLRLSSHTKHIKTLSCYSSRAQISVAGYLKGEKNLPNLVRARSIWYFWMWRAAQCNAIWCLQPHWGDALATLPRSRTSVVSKRHLLGCTHVGGACCGGWWVSCWLPGKCWGSHHGLAMGPGGGCYLLCCSCLLGPDLVLYCCCNKLSQMQWLKAIQILSYSSRGQKSDTVSLG